MKLGQRESINNYSLLQSLFLAAPLIILLSVFFLYPLISLFPESLIADGKFSLEHYRHFFREPLYGFILVRTIRIAAYVTVICFLIGYPVAYFLASLKNRKVSNLLMICVLLPFFTSILVRSYAWIVIFQTKGLINSIFLTLGIITGALWGDRVFGQLWFWDPKETWSFITWLIFMAYLHARYTLEWRGRRAAILAIVGFAALVFTYVGVDFLLPQIHGTQTG